MFPNNNHEDPTNNRADPEPHRDHRQGAQRHRAPKTDPGLRLEASEAVVRGHQQGVLATLRKARRRTTLEPNVCLFNPKTLKQPKQESEKHRKKKKEMLAKLVVCPKVLKFQKVQAQKC